MAYILDGAAILVVLLAVFIGYHRGFVRSLIQLVGLIAAAIIAAALSTGIAALVFDSFISDGLTETISSKIQATDTSSGGPKRTAGARRAARTDRPCARAVHRHAA